MAQMVVIGGMTVDAEDPCALWQALYAVKLKLLEGGRVEETELRSPVTTRRVKVSAGNLSGIEDELIRLAAACQQKNSGRRVRYAKRVRFTC